MPSWTKDQQQAIETRGGKVIVSAAAGSGKTAVLSERVINYVLNNGNIKKLLIVTFTEAAASEMKGRIKEKINEACKNNPQDKRLKKELLLSESAKITTMDAFYAGIVKDNFEKLGIKRNFKVLSTEEERILSDKVIKEVLENSFLTVSGYEDTLTFFGANNTNLIKDLVLKVASFLETLPFKDEFIKQAINMYEKENDFYKETLLKQVRLTMINYDKIYAQIVSELLEDDIFDKVLQTARKERNFINDLSVIKNFDDLSSRLRSISFDSLRTPKGHKEDPVLVRYKVIRDSLKNEINKNMYELSFVSDSSYEEEKSLCKIHLMCLFKVVNKYLDRLLEEKRKINSFSFSDVAHFVIDLLIKDGKKTNLAQELSLMFDEILIDEYQDTNNLQNVIFKAISKNDSNLFIVGDVKQSIYRFRSACPEIFNHDKSLASKDGFPRLISLAKNFRSRKEVLDFCNFVFENTMTSSFGEVNYDELERLYLGASFEDNSNLDTEVYLIDGKEKYDGDDEDLTKAQKEATYVAQRIRKLLDDGFNIYDNKRGSWRKIKPSDIVILLRSLKDSDAFIKALNKINVSVYCESTKAYFDNYEIKLIINMLKVIDNQKDDVALLSVLTSPFFNVSEDDIVKVRSIDKRLNLCDNILKSNDLNLKKALDKINELRIYGLNHSLSQLLSTIYENFNAILLVSALSDGVKRKKNLIQMLNHAVNFERDGAKGLHEFTNYLENLILNKDSLQGVNPLSDGDNVLITTIHKSKGLEYPVVFLCQTGKNFNFSDLRSNLMINQDLGISFPIRNSKYKVKYDSVPQMIFKDYEKNKMLSEELRVLYVALTRAKEKIIITGYANNLESLTLKATSKMGDEKTISNLYLKECKNYLEILLPCLLRHPKAGELRDLSTVGVKTFATEAKLRVTIKDNQEINSDYFNEEEKIEIKHYDFSMLDKIKCFNYDVSMSKIPLSLSVSDLKKNDEYLRKPNFMADGVNHARLGTLYHLVLESLPVKRYNVSLLKESLDDMVSSGIISYQERKLIKLEKILAFLTSDLYDLVLGANKVYKEREITFKLPAKYYDKDLKSGRILVDGVMDLLFIKDDTYYVVDYKTDNVLDVSELKKRYQTQLDLYAFGLKETMNAKNIKKFIYSIKLNKFIEL